MKRRLLVLGGISEALALARRLEPPHIYSLAGLGRIPRDLACQVRVGGFGGVEGLTAFLQQEEIALLLDMTHPYAARISAHAAEAAARAGIPCWALRRPGWQPGPGDRWQSVPDWTALQQALQPFRRPFFTSGRDVLAHLQEIPPHQFWTVRVLDAVPAPGRARIIGARGPFALAGERQLFAAQQFDVLVSKNSGSAATEPKLQVARELGLPVLLLARPELPAVARRFSAVDDLWQALVPWLSGQNSMTEEG